MLTLQKVYAAERGGCRRTVAFGVCGCVFSGVTTAAKDGSIIMATRLVSNEQLQEAWQAYLDCGRNKTRAAASLGLDRSTFRGRLMMAEIRGLHLPEGIREAIASVGIDDTAIVSGGWLKTKDVSVQFKIPKQNGIDVDLAADQVKQALKDLESVTLPKPHHTTIEMLTLYPLPDIHAGMKYKQWGLTDTVERLDYIFDQLISSTPQSKTALFLILGDLLHHNDRTNKTQSGHPLDVDCTPEDAAAAMVTSIARGIEMALLKHEEVIVSVLRGNHDRDAYLIVLYGWRSALLIMGPLTWLVVLPLSFVLKHSPEQYRLLPDGAPSQHDVHHAHGKIKTVGEIEVDFPLRKAMFTPAFWIIAICLFTHQVTQSAVFVHLIPYLTDVGIEPPLAASVVTLVTLTSIIGRYGFGWLSDLFNKKWLLFILFALQPIGIFSLVRVHNMIDIIPFLLAYSTAYGGNTVVKAVIIGDYYGHKNFGTIHN